MRVLITGADGQLGRELQRSAPDGFEIISLNRHALDITDAASVAAVFRKWPPGLVINAAAYTAVDKAETEAEKAYAVNADGAELIARSARDSNARLIHISTDFVFDGAQSEPYPPDARPNPLSIYGTSKLAGEKAVLSATSGNVLILRTGWLYSIHGHNFVKTMLRLMKEKEQISVVSDQIGTPTWTRGLAEAIYRFASNPDIKGIYHWSDTGTASWYDFAAAIQQEALGIGLLQRPIPLKPIPAKDYPTPAKRPAYSVLDKEATWKALGYKALPWRDSLRRMLKELKELGYE